MEKQSCSQLRTQLQEIKELKVEFDLELPKIKDTRDTSLALSLEDEMQRKIKSIKEVLILAHCEWVEITIGDRSKEELIKELEDREKSNNPADKIYISDEARSLFQNPDFTVINKPEKVTLIRLKVKDLGLKQGNTTTDELYQRAKELGLELCSPETGPHLRLNYQEVFRREQLEGEYLSIGMKQIADLNGNPRVFSVDCHSDSQRWLYNPWAKPDYQWNLESEFVFVCK
jgi:hypothetical protein